MHHHAPLVRKHTARDRDPPLTQNLPSEAMDHDTPLFGRQGPIQSDYTYSERRKRAQGQLVAVARWKAKESSSSGTQNPTSLADFESDDDEINIASKIYGDATASALATYFETRDRVGRMLRPFYVLEEERAKTIMVLENSITRLQNLMGGSDVACNGTLTDINKRETLLVALREEEHKTWLARESFVRNTHDYKRLVEHSLVDSVRLSPTTYAIRTKMLVLQLKTDHVWACAKDALQSFYSFQRDGDARFSKEHAQALSLLKIGMLENKGHMSLVSDCMREITATLMKVSLLEQDIDGLAYAHIVTIMAPFVTILKHLMRIREWAYRSPLLPLATRYHHQTAKALASIDESMSTLLIDDTVKIQQDLRNFQEHLFGSTKRYLEELGASSPLADRVRQTVVDEILKTYESDHESMQFRSLRRWGYHPMPDPSQLHFRIRKWNVRRNLRIEKWLVSSQLRIRYHDAKAGLGKFRSKVRPLQVKPRISRQHSRSKRKQALEKPHRVLVSPLSTFDEQVRTRNKTRKWVFRKIPQLGPAESRKAVNRGSRSSGRLHVNRNTYLRVPARNKQQRHLDYACRVAGARNDRDISSPPLTSLQVPSKTSTLGKMCSILGFGEAQESVRKALPDGIIRKTYKQEDRTKQKASSDRPTKKTGTSPRHGAFHPSPQLRAPHSILLFTDNDVSGRTSANSYTGVNEDVNSHDTGSNQGADGPGDNIPHQDNSLPSTNMLKENSDPYRPSDSEHDSGPESETRSESEPEENGEENTYVPLTYQIPPAALLAAIEAPPNTRASYWSQTLYRGPNDEKVLNHYCKTFEVAERVARYFLEAKVVGFDMEWKPWPSSASIKENASLVQLASENRIALFHIALFVGKTAVQLIPPSLKTILESPDIYKVGVNIKGDFTRLNKHLGIQARGVLELSRIHNLVECPEAGLKLVKLSSQVKQHLLLPLYKGEDLADVTTPGAEEAETGSTFNSTSTARITTNVRMSDWSQSLKDDQVLYAAADAYAGFRLYDVLESKRQKMKPVPPLPRLCDEDPVREVKAQGSTRKTKATKKAKIVAANTVDEEDSADTQDYQTAPEELDEVNDGEEAVSEPSSEGSLSSADDSDADYVPKCPQKSKGDDGQGATKSRASTRRIGRVNISRLGDGDAGYPTLPTSTSKGNSDLDESDAFDPLPTTRLRRPVRQKPIVNQTPEEHETDEFDDSELEEALVSMVIDDPFDDIQLKEQQVAVLQGEAITQDLPVTNGTLQPDTMDLDPPLPQQSSEAIPLPTFSSLIPAPSVTIQAPAFQIAVSWAQSYLEDTVPSLSSSSSRPASIRATASHLRAYYLWHHMRIPLRGIGALLRDPPLAQSTVSGYILQAVSLEKLEYEDERLRAVLESLPQGTRDGRWGALDRRLSGER
jgi:hypothetical protein